MLLTITIASPEIEDFVAEVLIESQYTFADLHQVMQKAFGWQAEQPTTFYVCDNRWQPEHAIPEVSDDRDTMADIELGDLLEDEGQRLQYVFNPAECRGLLMEVSAIAFGKHVDEPRLRKHGTPPPYSIAEPEEEEVQPSATTSEKDLLAQLNAAALGMDDEDDYEPEDTSDFDPEEFDPEGYEVSEL